MKKIQLLIEQLDDLDVIIAYCTFIFFKYCPMLVQKYFSFSF